MSSTPYFLSNPCSGAVVRWPALIQAWLPVFLFACVFVVESTSYLGANHTSQPLHNFLHSFLGASVDHNWAYTHHLLRKAGHFAGYGTLSLICFRGLRLTLGSAAGWARRDLAGHALAIGAAFLVASADEFHQTFLPNRTGTFSDVLLDTAGATAFQLLLFMAVRLQGRVSWNRWQLKSKRSMHLLQSAILPSL